ncbi:MAG: tetratricopeptide repeat protein, partial [Deltaproteobacteria bacterium]|nr:tetratricopeptide repeat protein [Deltaproteobacteria bacterium]
VEELKDLYLEFEEQQALYSEGRIKTAPVAPVADHSELINTYSIIVERYPRKPGIEAVLYTLGYALFEGNSYDRAGEVFIKFLSMYPKSDYYPEVAFRLGEIYFDASMYNKAISTYSMILEREDPVYFEKALYKISWCYYKLEEYSSSIDSFADLIDKVNETQGAGTASLKAEAKAQIIGSLAHMSIPEEVMLKISSSATREFAPTSLIGLITLLNNQTRNQDALEVFNIFNTIFHSNKLLPLAQAKTIETYRGMNDTEATLRVMEDMVKDFTPESPWYRSTFSDRKSPGAKEVDESVSKALLTLSKHYHSINEKNNDPEMLLKAMEGYKKYLLYYPYTKNEKEVYLLLGEASFSSKEYSDAASRYEKTMQFYNGKQEGEDAAFAALLSLELVSAGASEEEELDTAKSAEQLGRIVGFFLNNFPETKRFDDFTFKASGIYTSMGYYKEARQT